MDKWRERLATKRKEVEFWMNKVDKSCIERIRAFQTPPTLIGQIMEMSKDGRTGEREKNHSFLSISAVLTLIGRKPAMKFEPKEPEREKGSTR